MTQAAMSRIADESSAEARNKRSRSLKRAARANASLTLVRRLAVFAVILTAMFILMRLEHIACFIQPYQSEVIGSGSARGHAYGARLCGEFFIAGALVPDLELITPFWHITDCYGAFLIADGKVLGREREHNRAHP